MNLNLNNITLVERIEELWKELYERGFIELGDLKLTQAWIKDLLALGYKFPDITVSKILPNHIYNTTSSDEL